MSEITGQLPMAVTASDLSHLFSAACNSYKSGNISEAESLFQTILAADPAHADALQLLAAIYVQRGNALEEMKRYEDALASYDQAIALRPHYANAYNNRAIALQTLKRYEEALASYDKVIALEPASADAYYNFGLVLQHMKRYPEALASYDKAIALNPGHALAHNNRGIVLRELTQYDEAIAGFSKAIALVPNYADAYYNRGLTLKIMYRYEEALMSYDQALRFAPTKVEIHNNRGNVLQAMQRYDEAIAAYDQAIALSPKDTNAHYNRSNALRDSKRYEEACDGYAKALSDAPDAPYLLGAWLNTKMQLSDWEGIDKGVETLARGVEAGKLLISPFMALSTSLSLVQQRKCAEIYTENKCPPSNAALWNGEKYAHDKIRIGYFSADFHNHATAYLMAELFECHDRTKFEITAFSFGASGKDAMRERLEKGFDRFLDVRSQSDLEIATRARALEIDIAVDLKGFTQEARTGIFALRPAPVQVAYIGYPGTMAASYIDYVIADDTVIPKEHYPYYSEKIVALPHSYQVNDSKRRVSDRVFTRKEVGLPEKGFVFCCFNHNYKITAERFALWMRLLKKVEGSVLWLFIGNPASARNLRKQAVAHGVAEDRLVFAGYMPLPEHLARQKLADLFLDTFPYNAHTTASDALWVGLPVVTCAGETFASRVGASLLKAANLPELVTYSSAEYEDLALEYAKHPRKLAEIRKKLAENRPSCPLFDTKRFACHLEAAYAEMHQRAQNDLPPAHIRVPT